MGDTLQNFPIILTTILVFFNMLLLTNISSTIMFKKDNVRIFTAE